MHSIALVCEAEADARTVRKIAERLLLESPCREWINEENLSDFISWRGFHETDSYLDWKGSHGVHELAKQLAIVIRNAPLGTSPPEFGYATIRAIRVLMKSPHPPDAMILLSDSDNELERREGLAKGRDLFSNFPIVVGLAHTKRECWHLAGFVAANQPEEGNLDGIRRELKFDPTRNAHQLAGERQSLRCPKRVLAILTGDSHDREMQCLDTPLDELKNRGAETGLPEFLAELERRLLPLFGAGGSRV